MFFYAGVTAARELRTALLRQVEGPQKSLAASTVSFCIFREPPERAPLAV